jgi:hypothetical protein
MPPFFAGAQLEKEKQPRFFAGALENQRFKRYEIYELTLLMKIENI